MPGVIRAIDLLLLPLTNVINFFISEENKSTLVMLFSIFATFYFDPMRFKRGVHIYAQTHQSKTSNTCSKLIYLYIDV
jgi:hypothetical protein